jgi:hypothetical protein
VTKVLLIFTAPATLQRKKMKNIVSKPYVAISSQMPSGYATTMQQSMQQPCNKTEKAFSLLRVSAL